MKKHLFLLSLCMCAMQAHAADISVIGLFPGKAVLVIDGRSPKTYSVGDTVASSIKLVNVGQSNATFETNGKKQKIDLGEHINRISPSALTSVTLQADERGHFMVQGQINGGTIRMMVDTGASMIALSAADATRLGIDYKHGQPMNVSTANGSVVAYQVRLNSVKIGDLVLDQVDGLVQETGLPFALLGMSFLKRTEMRRDNEEMILTKRY